ncbi:MAG: NAD(P)-dependent glycerol-3-phosphate dehydrogenase, partial [Gammaproteobacteria bacterium]|nr:NAD(P)-dependent glycerol-3-phosphate dehydrogenase [Gammaproteobacteria bacterium]
MQSRPPSPSPPPSPPLPPSVSVIGGGAWGTALALALARNIQAVKLWGRDPARMREMAQRRCNWRYLPGVDFPPNLAAHSDFDALIDAPLCFVLATPSHAFRATVERLRRAIAAAGYAPGAAKVIWGTKGFDPESGRLLSAVVGEVFGGGGGDGGVGGDGAGDGGGGDSGGVAGEDAGAAAGEDAGAAAGENSGGKTVTRAVISGPSFAAETARGLPTALTLACADRAAAQALAGWFRGPATRVYFSDDLVGVQLGGAIKNVLAIAAGLSDGLNYGANARAALITRGLAELTRLGVALGGRADTFAGLTGLGDLVLTCTDDQSRNRRFGLGLGRGQPADAVRRDIGQAIEGIHAARTLHRLSRELGVDMPITAQVCRIVHEGHDPADA